MILIDTSVAIKWLRGRDEQYRVQALHLLHNHLDGREDIIVPELLFIEVANVLATKTDTTTVKLKKDLIKLNEFDLRIYRLENEDIVTTATQAKKFNTSVYDMLYVVIAQKQGISLYNAKK